MGNWAVMLVTTLQFLIQHPQKQNSNNSNSSSSISSNNSDSNHSIAATVAAATIKEGRIMDQQNEKNNSKKTVSKTTTIVTAATSNNSLAAAFMLKLSRMSRNCAFYKNKNARLEIEKTLCMTSAQCSSLHACLLPSQKCSYFQRTNFQHSLMGQWHEIFHHRLVSSRRLRFLSPDKHPQI